MHDTLTGSAPAKINLVLEVLGRRKDGYHEIRTVIQKVDLCDTVTLAWDRDPGITVVGPAARGTPATRDNLAWRAVETLRDLAGMRLPLPHIAIEKSIPAASGLGGGASDAATALRLVARAWDIDDESMLARAANAVGSDEAFFLGGPTALVSGRGEIVTPRSPLPHHGVVLFIPRETLPNKTATLFALLSQQPFDDGDRCRTFVEEHPAQISVRNTFNAFERVAFETFGGLGAVRDALADAIGDNVRLSGAGPALFWIGPRQQAAAVASRASDVSGIDVVVCQTLT